MRQAKDIHKQQQYWLGCMGTDVCVDTHCHCLPGLDDGPEDMVTALDLCTNLVQQGFTHVIATPHQLGYFEADTPIVKVQAAYDSLKVALTDEQVPLTILLGAEIRIDERIPTLLAQGEILTLGSSPYVLLEWPFETFFFPGGLFDTLRQNDYRPVIAHPERNQILSANPTGIMSWLEYEPIFQITAGSLTGRFGRSAAKAAWALLELPVTCLVATDAHDTNRRAPGFVDAFGQIVRKLGVAKAQEVCIQRPLEILESIPIAKTMNTPSGGKV